MNRRDFLKLSAAAPLAASSFSLHAAPAGNPRLLVVFMRGAYDAANLLVPHGSSFYYEARPNIAIPRPGAAANSALALDATWALHPSLRASLLPLYEKGQLAFVPFAGTDNLSRSHFETQDSIELGQGQDRARSYQSGFMNRLASVLAKRGQPIAFTGQVPVAFRGDVQVPNVALRQLARPSVDARQSAVIAEMYRNTALAGPVMEGFSTRDGVIQTLAEDMDAASRNALTARGFELEARRIARLMRDRYNLAFVDIGGWDTHVGQGGAEGYLANRLEELGRGVAAYADEMGGAWNDTVVVVISEFGRTFRENGNRGTDHGHGSAYWVLGGGVRGGRIAGEQVALTPATLNQSRDYPVLNEYRALFAGLFGRMYGLDAAQTERVFAGVKPKDFGLV
ncbi:MAG TPA: DUF1501 domain-containing protein [Burkholderiales bacterium]|nr:DUF1501 domain-containing protein [Burkholderiales bacterium]